MKGRRTSIVALILRLDVFLDIILNVTASGKSIRAHKFVLSYSSGVLRCYWEESGMSIYYRHIWYVICYNVKHWSIISTRTLIRRISFSSCFRYSWHNQIVFLFIYYIDWVLTLTLIPNKKFLQWGVQSFTLCIALITNLNKWSTIKDISINLSA